MTRKQTRYALFPGRRHNNRKQTNGRRVQQIFSEKLFILKEKYLTPKGKVLLALAGRKKADKEAVWAKYGKNRYILNSNAKQLHVIVH